jgi:hypothetical protein
METKVELESGDKLTFTSISSREVFVKHHTLSDVREKLDSDGNIIGLKIDDLVIYTGDVIPLRLFDKYTRPFKVKIIKRSRRKHMYALYSTKLTKASRWILPMIRLTNETQTSMKFGSHFVNCYVGTKEEGYLNNIYVLYRYSGDLTFAKFEDKLFKHDLYERRIDVDDHHVLYVFKMTKNDMYNYELFKKGKYSKFTDDYKKKILKFSINPAMVSEEDIPETSTYGILYKTDKQIEELKNVLGNDITVDIKKEDLELYSIPNEDEEVYTGDIEIASESSLEIARLEEDKE